MCGQVYDISCVNNDGVQIPVISAVVASTCESGRGSCGIDMVDSTWDAATSGADRDGIVQCTAELSSRSIFTNYDDMFCTLGIADSSHCSDCQSNPNWTMVALMNTDGEIVVSATADGNPMTHNDDYNQYYQGSGNNGVWTPDSDPLSLSSSSKLIFLLLQ